MTRFLWILAGLGMPPKVVTIASITGFSALAIGVVAWHVPTREHVVEAGRAGR